MNKHSHTKARTILLLLAMFILAACSVEGQTSQVESSTPQVESQPSEATFTAVPPTETAPAEEPPTKTPASAAGSGASAAGKPMECTLVSDQPDAPSELVAIFGVKENDWVLGSEGAALTIVEYGDFQ